MKPIIYESDYGKMLSYILSDLDNDDKKINQQTFLKYAKHFNVIYKTNNQPYNGLYQYNNDYISSNTIDKLDEISTMSNTSEYCSEIAQILRYIPKELCRSSVMLNIKTELPKIEVPYIANNRDDILIVEDMHKLQSSIHNLSSTVPIHQILDLYSLTFRLIIPRFMIDEICELTNNYNVSKTVLVDNNRIAMYYDGTLSNRLIDINNKRVECMVDLYRSTKQDKYLSNDVLYKVYLTRSLNEWIDIFNEYMNKYSLFKRLYTLLKDFPILYNIITYRHI